MTPAADVPSWNAVDRPLLETTALLCSQGKAPDGKEVAAVVTHLAEVEVLRGLARLIDRGRLTGTAIGAWQAFVPLRVVNLNVTAAGLQELSE